jgi:hypothetical protein
LVDFLISKLNSYHCVNVPRMDGLLLVVDDCSNKKVMLCERFNNVTIQSLGYVEEDAIHF